MRNDLTRDEARVRAQLIADIHYRVRLDLTTGDDTFTSSTVATFKCAQPGASTFIEFIGPSVEHATLNGKSLPASAFDGGRLQLEGLAAENRLEVDATAEYMHDGTGLHRFQDPVDGRHYLHSQFEANDAHRVYACFDQPDLKARFELSVTAPESWVVVSNMTPSRHEGGDWTFPATDPISTYITAIVTGDYASFHDRHGDIALGLYCRQSLAEYLDTDELFEITKQGLDFFVWRFAYPYPFGKYDQLFVPEFSAGAMENAACVTHSERMVYRSRVTEASRLRRAETILHEMAHMWFGDLATMKWFDDLWLNESFATYMAYVSMTGGTRFKNAWLDFATRIKSSARAQDQLPSTHPIVADIPDVEAVHLNFDAITYEKGASVLKQLVSWVGEERFYKGISEYFRRHAYGNTELPDFLKPLEEASGRDLQAWSRVWLETEGVNTLAIDLETDGGLIKRLAVNQSAPPDHPTLRPQRMRLGLYDLDGSSLRHRESVEIDVDGEATAVALLAGKPAPALIVPDETDDAYAKLRLDSRSLATAREHLKDVTDPLARAVLWGALWDMTRDAQLPARDFVRTTLANIDGETDSVLTFPFILRMESAIETYGSLAHRAETRESLAAGSHQRAQRAEPGSDQQLLWAMTFIDNARTAGDVARVRDLLDGESEFEGLKIDFAVRWSAVTALVRIGAASDDLIAAELKRDPTEEGRRFAATARASRPTRDAKEEAWSAVKDGDEVSLAMKRAFAAGFHRPDQEELLEPFVQRYFDELLDVWESHQIDEGLLFVRAMYPATIVTQEVVDLVDRMLKRDLPGPVRRALLEAQEGTARALRTRAADR
ncbi:MAG TPA: aminopeptidase N [Candidatus Dormibacteraeota bacterium]|nr:aminopeptidase N [Candidatus Dormibacteraeota bacterium]